MGLREAWRAKARRGLNAGGFWLSREALRFAGSGSRRRVERANGEMSWRSELVASQWEEELELEV